MNCTTCCKSSKLKFRKRPQTNAIKDESENEWPNGELYQVIGNSWSESDQLRKHQGKTNLFFSKKKKKIVCVEN